MFDAGILEDVFEPSCGTHTFQYTPESHIVRKPPIEQMDIGRFSLSR